MTAARQRSFLTWYLMKNNPKSQVPNHKSLLCLVFMLLLAAVVRAEAVYPQKAEGHVNDFAGILAETDKKTIGEMLKNFQKSSGAEMELVTVKSVEDYGGKAADIDSFSEGLLKEWGIGSQGDKGIIMLVSTGDRRIKIQTSGAFGPEYDDLMMGVVNKKVIPFFKQGSYGRGIYEGVREIIKQLSQKKTFVELYGNYAAAAAVAAVLAAALLIIPKRRKKTGNKEPDISAESPKQEKDVKGRAKAKPGMPVEKFGGGACGGW
jgi:uncharacterized membrane protein YgcG